MMSQSDFLKNAGRWGGSDVAARHYRAAVLSKRHYAESRIMPSNLSVVLVQLRAFLARRRGQWQRG